MNNPQLSIVQSQDLLTVLVLFAAIFQIATPILLFRKGRLNLSKNENFHDPPIVPASYAFSIWGLIYLASLAFTIYQILPQQTYDTLLKDIRLFILISFFGTSLWLVFAKLKWVWVCFACILIILFGLGISFYVISFHFSDISVKSDPTTSETLLLIAPISIFFGWITVATIANLAVALKGSQIMSDGISEVIWSVILLLVASTGACLVIYYSKGNLWYACTILWAFFAIVIANLKKTLYKWVAITASIMIFAVISITILS